MTGFRELTEATPFPGDYTGRHLIGTPTCTHVYRPLGQSAIRCLRYTKTKRSKYCRFHDTKSKRQIKREA